MKNGMRKFREIISTTLVLLGVLVTCTGFFVDGWLISFGLIVGGFLLLWLGVALLPASSRFRSFRRGPQVADPSHELVLKKDEKGKFT
jgi:hypothetical protein